MTAAGAKIIEGLKDAVAGNFSAVTIEGQRWVRAPEWLPIATAPRDGTNILTIRREWWEPANGNHRWMFGRVYESYFDSETKQFETHGLKQPTHWMPLLEPPMSA